jgi:hypothetical protein
VTPLSDHVKRAIDARAKEYVESGEVEDEQYYFLCLWFIADKLEDLAIALAEEE